MNLFYYIGKSSFERRVNPPHSHDYWELVYYFKGRGTSTAGGTAIPFSRGVLIAYPPGMEHEEESDGVYESAWISLRRDSRPKVLSFCRDEVHRPIERLVGVLHKEFHLKRPSWSMLCNGIIDLLFLYLSETRAAPDGGNYVERMKDMLIENIHEPSFTLKSALRTFDRSPRYLLKLFKEAAGVSPMQYLIDLRVKAAENLLATGMMSVREAAHELGFRDPYYFSRLFAKKTGVPPSRVQALRKR
ncbi:MAG: helix-turn-helix domain-containing protein [Spirochaetes bacterium]|nr:helix-turn-helix domain-containing protein [Spirochaetota bacterium]